MNSRLFLKLSIVIMLASGCTSIPSKADESKSNSPSVTIPSNVEQNAIIHHQFHPGEVFTYDYDDTDVVSCGILKDGIPVASASQSITQIKIPVKISILGDGKNLNRTLILLEGAKFRQGQSSNFGDIKFTQLNNSIQNFPSSFGYTYSDERSVLSHLFDVFSGVFKGSNFMSNQTAQFFFFKMQDIHQMQMSALALPEGMQMDSSFISPSHDVSGLGGNFYTGASQYIYVGTDKVDGVRTAQIRVTNLGNQFSTQTTKVYTNFTFTMYVAL